MLIILKEPLKVLDYEVVAVNFNTCDEIITSNLDNKFQLMIIKHFDGHFSNQSTLYRMLDIFDSHQECLDLFHKLIDALKTGERVFDLRSNEDTQSNFQSPQNRRNSGVL